MGAEMFYDGGKRPPREGRIMARHTYNFEGGEELTTISASWFVSYSYYQRNNTHINWQETPDYANRISVFNRTGDFHQFWLQQVLEMNDNRLGTNEIGLTGPQVKQMARELLG
jgi:hypothetical protein